MLGWLTPGDDEPDGEIEITINFPGGLMFEALARGALLLLCDEANYEQYGELTPAETAQIFRDVIMPVIAAWAD